jgi:hypothetical protein
MASRRREWLCRLDGGTDARSVWPMIAEGLQMWNAVRSQERDLTMGHRRNSFQFALLEIQQ